MLLKTKLRSKKAKKTSTSLRQTVEQKYWLLHTRLTTILYPMSLRLLFRLFRKRLFLTITILRALSQATWSSGSTWLIAWWLTWPLWALLFTKKHKISLGHLSAKTLRFFRTFTPSWSLSKLKAKKTKIFMRFTTWTNSFQTTRLVALVPQCGYRTIQQLVLTVFRGYLGFLLIMNGLAWVFSWAMLTRVQYLFTYGRSIWNWLFAWVSRFAILTFAMLFVVRLVAAIFPEATEYLKW